MRSRTSQKKTEKTAARWGARLNLPAPLSTTTKLEKTNAQCYNSLILLPTARPSQTPDCPSPAPSDSGSKSQSQHLLPPQVVVPGEESKIGKDGGSASHRCVLGGGLGEGGKRGRS